MEYSLQDIEKVLSLPCESRALVRFLNGGEKMNVYKELAKARRIFRENLSIRMIALTRDGICSVLYGAWLPVLDSKVYYPVYRFSFEESDIKAMAEEAREILIDM